MDGDGRMMVTPAKMQDSSMLPTLARADALPFRTASFHVVVSGDAGVPPVRNDLWWAEAGRVTKAGGAVLVLGDAVGAPDDATVFPSEDGATATALVRRNLA